MYEKDFSDKQETDWLKLATKVWNSRILIFKVCSIGAVVGIIIALALPKNIRQVYLWPMKISTNVLIRTSVHGSA
jgi:LPS O-antigen subunit length determinant protein (WzzB/FepE family)